MSILSQIQADQLAARKSGDAVARGLLTALAAETAIVGKNARNGETTDAEAIAVIRKFVKNAQDTLTILEKAGKDTAVTRREIELLEGYLPKEPSGEEIETMVRAAIAETGADGPKAMGAVMAALKTKLGPTFNGATFSPVVKRLLV